MSSVHVMIMVMLILAWMGAMTMPDEKWTLRYCYGMSVLTFMWVAFGFDGGEFLWRWFMG